MIVNHVTVVAAVWEAVACIGFVLVTTLFIRSFGDWVWVIRNRQNGLREYKARTTLWVFGGGILGCIANVTAATAALEHKDTWIISFISKVFIVSTIVSMIFALIINYRRIRLIELVEQGDRQ